MRSVSIKLIISVILALLFKSSLCAQPYGLDSRSPIGAFLNQKLPPSTTVPSGAWTVVNAFPNLTFEDPTSLTPEPGGNRLFVTGRQGYIWSFINDPGTTTKTLFLDLSAKTQGWDDCGMLGIAFHPQYGQSGSPNRGYVYVYYQFRPENILGSASARPPADTIAYNRLSRFTVPDGALTADPNSEQILINQFDRHLWHNGGGIFFGSDGFLYLSNGDEGNMADTYGNAQRINFGLFSGVLRIDVDRNISRSHPIRRQTQSATSPPAGWPGNFNGNYYIPNDNPWLDANGGILEEFWAIGLRSPHRMTFDPPTGQIWLGDVGQDRGEEVDLIEKGGNYQWVYKEGSFVGYKNMPSPLTGTDKPPIHAYPHDQGDGCVIGGYVYRGSRFAADLGGKYIFGDNGSGRIWTLTYNGSSPATVTYLVNMPPGMNYAGGLSSFGIDRNNELFMCTMGSSGRIWKLDRSGSSGATIPALLSQTGVFTSMSTMATAPGLIPYDVNAPLWSDAAIKQRWIALPNDGAPYSTSEQVAFAPTGEWFFPQGTVFVKHFELGTDDRNPNIKKRLETRLLVRDNAGAVYGVTYKWRADNSDADLLTGSVTENITIATATGTRNQTWYYPSRQDCLTCHNPNAGHVLGVKTRQLNGNFTYPGTARTDNQLRTWNHVGMFNPALNEASIPNYSKLVNVTNNAAPLEDRVRSYIDANCAQCHRPNGVQGYFDARFDTPLANQGIVQGTVANNLGIAGAKVVASGDVSKSIMHLRMNATDLNKMPPLARNVVDTQAVAVLNAWINSLPPAQGLPSPWQHSDIGNVGQPGEASFASGTFTVQASGDDIWNTSDAFHFVYQPLTGDGQIVARVTALQNTDGWAKSGVMIREGLAANARNAAMLMSFNQGASFQKRLTTGGASTDTTLVGPAIPYWVRIVRAGSTLTGYSSSNGVTWIQISSTTIAMSNPVYIGLAVTAHNNTVLNTSTLDNIQVTLPGGTPPTIATQPQNQTVNAGSNVTFSVQANGTAPLSYQWRLNSTNLSGATASSLLLLNIQSNNAGPYSVVVTNTSGSITSSIATLTVIPPPNTNIAPTIATQPQSQTANVGSNVTFAVQANGTAPLSYQWRFNSANLSGATATSLILLNVQTNNGGNYSVVVTNTSGSITSSIATLTVIPPPNTNIAPTITTQPQSQTANVGSNVTFSVQANGTAPLSFQWRFNSANLSGATASSLILLNVQTNNGGNYSVVVTNTSGSITSSVATLTVIPPASTNFPAPWQHQDIGNIGLAGDASFASGIFTIKASGDDIWNAADAFHFVYQALTGDGEIVARVTALQNTDGWAKSGVMIREGLAANARHASMLMTFNQGASFQRRLTVGGASTDNTLLGPAIPYWVRLVKTGNTLTGYSSSNGVNWVQISTVSIAMSNPVYIGMAVTAHNTTTLNTSTLDNIQVILPGGTPPGISTQPQSQTVNAGSNVTFTIQATGTVPLNFQWRFNSTNLSGATASSLTLFSVQTNNAGPYSVIVTNSSGSITSSIANLTVIPPPNTNIAPTIAIQPQSQTVNAGSNVTFTVQANGAAPLRYQWRFNSTNLGGATNSTLALPNVQTNNAGTYSVIVTNISGSITSSNATLTVIPPPITNIPPTIATQPQNQTVNVGSNVTFTVQANGTAPLRYQWRFNSANLGGATNSSLILLNVQTNNAGTYSVVVTNISGSVTSANAILTVIPPPSTNLPSPWQHQDIGNVALVGGATFTNTTFTVRASGDDIWNNADAFHFVYQPLNGNGQVVARVVGIQNTDGGWAKAGVMIRESLTPGSRHAFMTMSTGNGASFEWRTNASGLSSDVTVRGLFVPYWVKLTRTGNVFSGYDSVDGTNWVLVGNITIPLSTNTYAGLAVTAHDNSVINTSTFDNVLVFQSLPSAPSFVSPRRLPNGFFTVTLQGTSTRSYEILGSTNFINWSILTTLTNIDGQAQFTETNSAGPRFRFYRARLLP